jgi:hypothetical protein
MKSYREQSLSNVPPVEQYTYAELSEDALSHIFSFSDVPTLNKINSTCKRWREVATRDYFWTNHTNNPPEKNVRNAYVEQRKEYYESKYREKAKQFHSSVDNAASIIICAVCVIGYFSITIGLLYASIVLQIFLDGRFRLDTATLWFTYIPIVILFIGPFAIAIIVSFAYCTILAPTVQFVKLFRKAEGDCSEQVAMPLLSFLFIGYLGFIPCIAIGTGISYFIAPSQAAFRLSFLPVHIFTILYVVLPIITMIFHMIASCTNPLNKETWGTLGTMMVIHSIGIFTNGCASLQILLISAKLDNAISTYWSVVFVPIYVLLAVLIFGWAYFCCCIPLWRKLYEHDDVTTVSFIVVPMLVCITLILVPVFIWLLLLGLRLDLIMSGSYGAIFAPLYVSHGLNITGLCVLLGLSLYVIYQ